MSGLTEAARKVRRTKNLVSMKFNLLNFLMETLSVLLLLAIKSYFIRILYLLVRYIYLYLYLLSTHISLLVSYCGTPLVYYLGMEENRKAAQAYLKSTIQVVRRPAKVAPSPAASPLPSGVPAPLAGVFTVEDGDIKTAQSAHTIPGQVEELKSMGW